MAEKKDELMQRSKSQVLYRYLPGAWIDFSYTGQHRSGSCTAKVAHWHSQPLTDQDLNRKRVLRLATAQVRKFESLARQSDSDKPLDGSVGFPEGDRSLTEENCDVLKPRVGEEESGIVAHMDPLVFVCDDCKKVYQFRNYQEYLQHGRTCHARRYNGGLCQGQLFQLKLVYYCPCGWATSELPPRAREEGVREHLKLDYRKNFAFTYENPHTGTLESIEMEQACPHCHNQCRPKPALSSGQFFAQTFAYIDLIDRQTEAFLTAGDEGRYLTLAAWLGDISQEELQQAIAGTRAQFTGEAQKRYEQMLALTNDEQMALLAAQSCAGTDGQSDTVTDLKAGLSLSPEDALLAAEKIFEYKLVAASDAQNLDDAMQIAAELNTTSHPERYRMQAQAFGFTEVRLKEDIPFVSCAYGYTRAKPQYEPGVQLHAFARDAYGGLHSLRNNIYADKFLTEGVLFELDRRKVLDWLVVNDFVAREDLPEPLDERALKLWFTDQIHLDAIMPFTPIEEQRYPKTAVVYRLIHTISHELIRAVADICGLERDSLSEYLFPNVPAVLIYCQNTQGFDLGALKNTFEAAFDRWLEDAARRVASCVFDPICEDRYKACTGCAFLNEISCEHFNKDLDRTLLKGYQANDGCIKGFWEDVIYGQDASC